MFVNFKGPPVSSHKAAIVPTVCEQSNVVLLCSVRISRVSILRLGLFKVTVLTVTDAKDTAWNPFICG